MDLDSELISVKGVGVRTAEKLAAAGFASVGDVIDFLPRGYEDFSEVVKIADLAPGKVTIRARAEKVTTRNIRWRMSVTTASLADDSGKVAAVWFNQPYRATQLGRPDDEFYFSGEFGFNRGRYQLTSPSAEAVKDLPVQTGRILPIYRAVRGLKSSLVRSVLDKLRPVVTMLPETLPAEIVRREKLLSRADAMLGLHFPESAGQADVARQRLAFEELFGLLLASRLNKKENSKLRGYKIKFNQPQIKDFVAKLPFKLTNAQRRAIWDILCDFEKPHPMNRMLQGDVGSGKTVVAGAAAYQASLAGYQTAIMAPTEILASQHAATLDKLLSPFGVRVALLTSSVKGKARQKLYKVLASGEIDVVVGTHALIQPTVKFHKLGFTVIDEQHRFGVKQRQELSAKSENILQHKNSYKQDSLVCNLQGQTLNSLSSDAQKLLKTYPKFADGRIDYTNQKICYVTNCTVICGDEILLTERGADVIAYPNSLNGVSGFIDDLSLTLDAAVRQELSEELSAPSDFQLRIGAESVQLDEELGREWRVFPALAIFDKKFKPKTNWENKTAKWVKLSDVGKLKLMQHYAEVLKLALALQGPSLTKNILQHKNSYKQDSLVCERMPHLLSMTATPIPRSLQLTVFGDLDISVLNEQPAGRQPITTRIYQPTRRAELYKLIREQLDQGRQAYVVTPLIEQAEQADTSTTSTSRCKDRPCNKPSAARTVLVTNSSVVEKAAAEAEYKKIVKVYKDFRVGLLHGRLKPDEKDRVMRDFADHKLDILVATTVIEVGVDVPNASVMLIENADQFGLSQLHQLRGRVGRGEHQSFCYLMVSDNRPPTRRLREIEKSTDGFYLSEIDLQLRGPGEIYGTAQHGDLNLQVANLADTKLIARAAKAAENFINSGANLAKYPELRHNVSKYQRLTTLN